MINLGFFLTSGSRTHVRFQFSTHEAAGGNVAPSSAFEAADIRIYRAADGAAYSATQRSSANGITMTSPFDSLTGYHDIDIDLTDNTDAGFYAAGYSYTVVLAPDETVDSQTITAIPIATFEIGVPTANLTQWLGTAAATPTVAGVPEVDVTHLLGTGWLTPGTAGTPDVNVKLVSGDATAADTLELFAEALDQATGQLDNGSLADNTISAAKIAADAITAAKVAADVTTEIQSGLATSSALASLVTTVGVAGAGLTEAGGDGDHLTAINLPNQTMDIVGNITGNLSGSVGSVTGAVGSVTGAVGSVTGAVGSVTGAVGSVTGNVGGNVTGSVGSLATQAKADVNAEVVDALSVDTYAEPTGVPAATASLATKIGTNYMMMRNQVDVTATKKTFYDDGGSAEFEKDLSDDGTTYSESETNAI